jgi:hypothetical protein
MSLRKLRRPISEDNYANTNYGGVIMPRGDGTGPPGGGGPGTGRGLGRGRSRMGGVKAGAGPGGNCVCPSCGAVATHQAGVPCYDISCPKCGAKMTRGA